MSPSAPFRPLVRLRAVPSDVRAFAARVRRVLTAAARHPGHERNELLQIAKSAVASVLAWLVAVRLLHSPSPYFAPLGALLAVNDTVYRSVLKAAQRTGAVLVGTLLALAVGTTLGTNPLTIGAVCVAAMLIGRWRRLGDQGVVAPVTALIFLTFGGSEEAATQRISETFVGAVVGVVVSLVAPPLHLDDAARSVLGVRTKLADLLDAMGEGLQDDWNAEDAARWTRELRALDQRTRASRSACEQSLESLRLNPRHRLHRHAHWPEFEPTLSSLERAVVQVRAVARSLSDAADDSERLTLPGREFLSRYGELLATAARAARHFGGGAATERGEPSREVEQAVGAARKIWEDLSRRTAEYGFDSPARWPVYGVLLGDAERMLGDLARGDAQAEPLLGRVSPP